MLINSKKINKTKTLIKSFCILLPIFLFSIGCANSDLEIIAKNPMIICFKGTCSSGKSTLIKSIALKYKNLVIIDEDAIVFKRYAEAIAQRFPNESATITKAVDDHNFYHSLRIEGVYYFKDTSTKEDCFNAKQAIIKIQDELNKPENLSWKQEISGNITQEVLNNIWLALKQNKNILLDAWYVTSHHLQELFPEAFISRVLIYCSLPVAYERLLKRNEEAIIKGNLQEKRLIGQLLGSFLFLYDINHHPKQAIQRIDINDLDQTFNLILQKIPNADCLKFKPIFTFQEISYQQFQTIYLNFVNKFKEFEFNNFYISSKEEYDLIIDNSSTDIQKTLNSFSQILKM